MRDGDQPTMVLRRVTEADEADVWNLHVEQLVASGAHAGDGPWDDDLRDLVNSYPPAGGDFLVGEIDGRIVAMGGLRRVDAEVGEIKRMRVHREHTRRGYAEQILARLEACAQELGYRRLVLDTTAIQIPAQRLYEKSGFRETGRGEWEGWEVIYYAKDLPPGATAAGGQLRMRFDLTGILQPVELPPNHRLRLGEPGDEAAWTALLNDNGELGPWDAARQREKFADGRIRLADVHFVVRGDTLAATACIQRHAGVDPWELGWVAAHPQHRGRGLGRAVSLSVLHSLKALGARWVFLRTDDHRIPALRVYRAIGFQPDLSAPGHGDRWAALEVALSRQAPSSNQEPGEMPFPKR